MVFVTPASCFLLDLLTDYSDFLFDLDIKTCNFLFDIEDILLELFNQLVALLVLVVVVRFALVFAWESWRTWGILLIVRSLHFLLQKFSLLFESFENF